MTISIFLLEDDEVITTFAFAKASPARKAAMASSLSVWTGPIVLEQMPLRPL